MDGFPKEGPIAKAIVYFIISKLNTIYEKLPKQKTSDECVELRHFTIIDEAHYMLDFDNKPLRDLIAVGRNKGLSIILATQNMDSFKSKHFDLTIIMMGVDKNTPIDLSIKIKQEFPYIPIFLLLNNKYQVLKKFYIYHFYLSLAK